MDDQRLLKKVAAENLGRSSTRDDPYLPKLNYVEQASLNLFRLVFHGIPLNSYVLN